jgi:hypothetical protein
VRDRGRRLPDLRRGQEGQLRIVAGRGFKGRQYISNILLYFPKSLRFFAVAGFNTNPRVLRGIRNVDASFTFTFAVARTTAFAGVAVTQAYAAERLMAATATKKVGCLSMVVPCGSMDDLYVWSD